jgi:hypothetical protein
MFWGDSEIDWTILHSVCEDLTEYHHLRSKFNIRTSEIKYVFRRFVAPDMESHHANRVNFIYELHRARGLKFTNDRDHVFAWLGHYSKHWTFRDFVEGLNADYEKSVVRVYIDLAKLALQVEAYERNNDGSALVALAAVQHLSLPDHLSSDVKAETTDEESLPSWVADWRTYQSFILSEPINPHRAHGTSSPKLEFDRNDRLLRISGLEVDIVEICSQPLATKQFHIKGSPEENGQISAIERIWRDICGKDQFNLKDQYPHSEYCSTHAYMQTLSNGCVQIAGREKMRYHDIPVERWLEQEALYLTKALGPSKALAPDLRELAKKAEIEHKEEQWSRSTNGASKNRIFAKTKNNFYVLGPKVMKPGDIICVLFGGKLPFCLRPWGNQYLLVGECYAYGLMNGEALEMMDRQELAEKVFEIV